LKREKSKASLGNLSTKNRPGDRPFYSRAPNQDRPPQTGLFSKPYFRQEIRRGLKDEKQVL